VCGKGGPCRSNQLRGIRCKQRGARPFSRGSKEIGDGVQGKTGAVIGGRSGDIEVKNV